MTEKENYERKRISVITVTGGMIFSVLSMVAGSWLGTAGTLYGAAFGSGFSAIGGTVYENMARKAHAKMRARKEQEEVEQTTISPLMREKLMQERKTFIARREQDILRQQHRDPWKIATVTLSSLVLFILVTLGTMFGVEKATGQTLHSLLPHHGARQYGTSFSYSTVRPKVSVTPSPLPSSPVPSSPSAIPDAVPDASPDMSPTGGASSPDQTSMPSSLSTPGSTAPGETAPGDGLVPSSSTASTP